MAFTKVPKPTTLAYTNVYTAGGKEAYDESSLTYDDANTFYDGFNPAQWTGLSKPSTNNWVDVAKPI